ncbi:uncharacterized protein LOC132750851 [Ruditapes philippinarum]|uniref:uncharacterized protein LOC132750851 n=1 Tax=Ruditapes philippinarum TaxID=129788 RepID=UPI00295BF8CC|nr:uncharacterized protein LOC132750851 [Ruditapes philippinarum]
MVCCVFCAGEGFCSKCVSIMVSLTFSFHAFGFLSPYWFCDGDDCKLMGLYFHCYDGTCDGEVLDDPILTLVVIILISSLTLALTLCFVLHCTKYEWRKMSPKMSLFIGGWFLIQEILTTSVLIAIAVKYDRIGWSAYVFTVPGIIFLGFMMLVLIYMWCFPTKTVNPS